ncbi:YHS domain protein [Flavobacterium faecale]|uniref:YHS domain protein n=1 Tax=Flavobacterium faecale TaxID=1355330 RepID=A0A2S1LIG9_9FLAO|nr:YHS domain-containing (seleno)protein [Flavobacterium faecale]AWG23590.1 YHS domain protein [Flavobacterium faecale]
MKKQIVVLIMFFFSTLTFAQKESQRKEQFNLEQSVAIQGYDPVAYFTDSKGVKGKKEISTSYKGVEYHFASVAHKALFLKNPTHYEPEYGGWCAYAMGLNGEKVAIDPKTFKIVDGKLYLFYNAFFNNTLKDWNKNELKLKMKADTYWQKITQ